MVDAYLRQSPLDHLHLDARAAANAAGEVALEAGVTLSEHRHCGQLTLRGDSSKQAFRTAVKKALNVDLPIDFGTAAGSAKSVQLLCQGPDEWLVVTPSGGGDKALKSLATATRTQHAAVVDVSESRTVIRVSGPRAGDVLAKGCAVDLHPRAFGPGRLAETLLASAHVIIHQVAADDDGDGAAFDVYVHRSFAEYLWTWLEDAGGEYGVRVEAE